MIVGKPWAAESALYLRDAGLRLRLLARHLGPIGLAGLGLASAAVAVMFTLVLPAREQARAMNAQLTALADARSTMRDRSAGPADRAGDFLSRFPTRDELPSVLAAFEASAGKAGVRLLEGSYRLETPKGATLSRYSLQFPLKGTYPALREFVGRTLVAVPAASLDGMRFERAEVAEGLVEAELRFTIFVRNAP